MNLKISADREGEDHPLLQSALDAFDKGDLKRAENIYRDLLARDDRNGLAHNNLANLLRQAGHFAEAEAHYRRGLEFIPDSAEIPGNLGGTLEYTRQYVQAEIEYRRALELRPDFAEARFNLGLFLLAGGRYEGGWPDFD